MNGFLFGAVIMLALIAGEQHQRIEALESAVAAVAKLTPGVRVEKAP